MGPEFLQGVVLLLLTAIGAIAGFGIRAILNSLQAISEKLSIAQTDVAGIKAWSTYHEEEDDRRFDQILTKET